MFGSVFRMQVQAGKKQQVIDTMMNSGRTIPGMVAAYIYESAGDDLWGVAVFKDEAAYKANAASGEQDAEFQKTRALLKADVEWHDGNVHAWPGNPA